MEDEDEDALVHEELELQNRVYNNAYSDPVTLKLELNRESELKVGLPTLQQNGKAHFENSPLETSIPTQQSKN